jgi:hypothetical protein
VVTQPTPHLPPTGTRKLAKQPKAERVTCNKVSKLLAQRYVLHRKHANGHTNPRPTCDHSVRPSPKAENATHATSGAAWNLQHS